MSRPPHALQQRRDRARRADLAHQVHRADVDPELERRRRHERLELALLEPRLGVEPRLKEGDRKSTRLNSSHGYISYAVFCLKKKNDSQRARKSPVDEPH